MKILRKNLFFLILAGALSCGGGGGSGGSKNDLFNPSTSAGTDLASLAVNTFLENDISITVNPTYLDFGTTTQYIPLTGSFTLTNGTSQDKVFTISFYGTGGGFRLVNTDGTYTAYQPDLLLGAGESAEFDIEFDATLMGERNAYLEITAAATPGYIHLPFRATVIGPDDFKVIAAGYMCADRKAPNLTELDFMKVASEREKTLNVKICNTGGSNLTLNSILFEANPSTLQSDAMSFDPFEGFTWDVDETLNAAYVDYYNPEITETFDEPTYINFAGTAGDTTAAFSVREHSRGLNPVGFVIEPGSHVVLDVTFSPTLEIEAPAGQLYNPISYTANMVLSTGLGPVEIDLLGASAGKEPILEMSYVTEDAEAGSTGTVITGTVIPLDSRGAAINFGVAGIFEDWITEDEKEVTVTVANMGSGSKNLKLWADSIEEGYFTFAESTDSFPIELSPGEARTFEMIYAPTPEEGVASESYDLGQMMLRTTAGNGPTHPLTLVGEQTESQAVEVFQDITKLKSELATTPYSEDNRKSFCVFQIGETTEKPLTIVNHSGNYVLTSRLSGSTLTDDEGAPVSGSVSFSSSSVTTQPNGGESPVTLNVTLASSVEPGTVVEGQFTIENSYPSSVESEYGESPADYSVYFRATASESGECTGGDGSPVHGQVLMGVDRITMILDGLETARNPAAYEWLVPLHLDKDHGTAMMGEVLYDPINTNPNDISVFKPYMHQISVVNNCFALPTSPYETEVTGWTDPNTQCAYEGAAVTLTGNEACIPANKPELYEDGSGIKKYIFYHEFVKFTPGTCEVEMEGRIATFILEEGQSVKEVFDDLESKVGINRSAAEYQSFLGTFNYGSFITFHKPYESLDPSATCSQAAGTTLNGTTDVDAIRDCWTAFLSDPNLIRANLWHEECSYMLFNVEAGCVPSDVPWVDEVDPATVCTDTSITYNDPDTWKGFGEYEPAINLKTGEEEETKWDMTLRNLHLEGSLISNSLGIFFDNTLKLLFADLNATLTTKPIGISGSSWDDLIAPPNRSDFDRDDIFLSKDQADFNWISDTVNGVLTAGGDDDIPCFEEDGTANTLTSCRGNYMVTEDGTTVVTAGEPIDFVNNNRFMVVGYGLFRGEKGLAPGFAQKSDTGKGKALIFTLHGCVQPEGATSVSCYDGHIDNIDQNGDVIPNLLEDYRDHNMLTEADYDAATSSDPAVQQTSKAWVDYRILDVDRNRMTDYYNPTSNYFYDTDYTLSEPCGFGM